MFGIGVEEKVLVPRKVNGENILEAGYMWCSWRCFNCDKRGALRERREVMGKKLAARMKSERRKMYLFCN